MKILTFLFAMFCSMNLMASNGLTVDLDPPTAERNTRIAFSKIFYSDYSNTTLFIDFEALGNQFTQLNILRDDQLMMEDDVTDLPQNTIYEINLEVMRKGTYTLELQTQEGVKVIKEFVIN